MGLFARMPAEQAERCVEAWPHHSWHFRSLTHLFHDFEQHNDIERIKEITLNEPLMESIREGGFVNPLLFTHSWYPICGSQRLRAALELTKEERDSTVVRVCRFHQPVWRPLSYWPDKDESIKATQLWFQMAEVAFKSLYCVGQDNSGTDMLYFEEYGNQLHWDVRDGKKK